VRSLALSFDQFAGDYAVFTPFAPEPLRAWAFAEKLESGSVGVNVNDTSELQAPFDGWKLSGMGRELGVEGLMAFREPRHIRIRLRGGRSS
jgi:succinate-semialdehyde dehydrogenase / glutarate-semialdehyde dehydrogenase